MNYKLDIYKPVNTYYLRMKYLASGREESIQLTEEQAGHIGLALTELKHGKITVKKEHTESYQLKRAADAAEQIANAVKAEIARLDRRVDNPKFINGQVFMLEDGFLAYYDEEEGWIKIKK